MVNKVQKININLQHLQYTISISRSLKCAKVNVDERISTLWYDLRVRHFNLAVLCSISNISYARYIVYFYSRFVIDHKQRKTDICAAYLCQKLDCYCFFTKMSFPYILTMSLYRAINDSTWGGLYLFCSI